MRAATRPLGIVALLALSGGAAACTGAESQSRPVNPARPTPATAHPSADRPTRTADDAISVAEFWISGIPNTGLSAAGVRSVVYVQTTVGQAANFIGSYLPDRLSLIPPGTTAWLFVAQGEYAEHSRFNTTPPPLKPATPWVLVIQGDTPDALNGFATKPLDLTQLGTPVVVPPGRVPAIDRVRAPVTATATAAAGSATPAAATP